MGEKAGPGRGASAAEGSTGLGEVLARLDDVRAFVEALKARGATSVELGPVRVTFPAARPESKGAVLPEGMTAAQFRELDAAGKAHIADQVLNWSAPQ